MFENMYKTSLIVYHLDNEMHSTHHANVHTLYTKTHMKSKFYETCERRKGKCAKIPKRIVKGKCAKIPKRILAANILRDFPID